MDESADGYPMRERGPDRTIEGFTDLMSKSPWADQIHSLLAGRSCVVHVVGGAVSHPSMHPCICVRNCNSRS